MNTLARTITANFFDKPDGYPDLCKRWSDLVNSESKHQLRAAHHLLYLCLRGKDWRRGFAPVTNPRKLSNGGYYAWGLFRALRELHYGDVVSLVAPFQGLVTPAAMELVRGLLGEPTLHRHKSVDFSSRTYPFDAYPIAGATLAESRESEASDV